MLIPPSLPVLLSGSCVFYLPAYGNLFNSSLQYTMGGELLPAAPLQPCAESPLGRGHIVTLLDCNHGQKLLRHMKMNNVFYPRCKFSSHPSFKVTSPTPFFNVVCLFFIVSFCFLFLETSAKVAYETSSS